jgi:DNA-binding transcriptional MerR regulator
MLVVGLTVAVVARRVGVAPATLRTWERRYGLSPSDRSQGGHRRYCVTDIARLEMMRRLVLAGMPAGQAAKVALESEISEIENISILDQITLSSRLENLIPAIDFHDQFGHPGGGPVLAMQGTSAAARGLAKASSSLDVPACNQIIGTSINSRGVIWTWENLISKVLIVLGRKWELTGEGIEAEHMLSECVISQMKQRAELLTHPVNTRTVLLAAAPDDLHTIPQYVTAAALAERRISSRVMGPGVPHQSIINATKKLAPAAVLIWATMPVKNIPQEFENLTSSRPAPMFIVAGPGWPSQLPKGFVRSTDLSSTVTAFANIFGA